MTVPVDWFGMHELFYYPLLLCLYRNGWQIWKCVLCMTVKIKHYTISYKLHEYMPSILPSLSSLLLLLLHWKLELAAQYTKFIPRVYFLHKKSRTISTVFLRNSTQKSKTKTCPCIKKS